MTDKRFKPFKRYILIGICDTKTDKEYPFSIDTPFKNIRTIAAILNDVIE